MKICKYCDSENPDSVTICPSCGAHEFKYKCNNCGTVFENSNYCPCCGVKAGAEPKNVRNAAKAIFLRHVPIAALQVQKVQICLWNIQANHQMPPR